MRLEGVSFCRLIQAKPLVFHEKTENRGFLRLVGNSDLFATIFAYFADFGRRNVGERKMKKYKKRFHLLAGRGQMR